MTPARCPAWALANGMPPPHDGESFAAYWSRMGIDQRVIDGALSGLRSGAEDVANDRMAEHLRRETAACVRPLPRRDAAPRPPSCEARKIDPTTATKGEGMSTTYAVWHTVDVEGHRRLVEYIDTVEARTAKQAVSSGTSRLPARGEQRVARDPDPELDDRCRADEDRGSRDRRRAHVRGRIRRPRRATAEGNLMTDMMLAPQQRRRTVPPGARGRGRGQPRVARPDRHRHAVRPLRVARPVPRHDEAVDELGDRRLAELRRGHLRRAVRAGRCRDGPERAERCCTTRFVCRQVPKSRRQANVAFGAHALVARMEPREQNTWLKKASRLEWGERELREAIKAKRVDQHPDPLFEGEGGTNMTVLTEVAGAILRDAVAYVDGQHYLVPNEDIARLRRRSEETDALPRVREARHATRRPRLDLRVRARDEHLAARRDRGRGLRPRRRRTQGSE